MGFRKKKHLSKLQLLKKKRTESVEALVKKHFRKKNAKVTIVKKPIVKLRPKTVKKHNLYAKDSTLMCYDGVWVKRDAVESLDKQKAELMQENLSNYKFRLQMLRAKRKANRVVQREYEKKMDQKMESDEKS